MTNELKPCPFCGGTDLSSGGDDKFVGYFCKTCQATGPNHYGSREWNTRPAAPVEGLETQWNSPRELLAAFGADDIREGSRTVLGDGIEEDGEEDYLEAPIHVIEKMRSELVPRSQAEAIIAAKDAVISFLSALLGEEICDNAALTPRVRELKEINSGLCRSHGVLNITGAKLERQIETLEADNAALTARVKELEQQSCDNGFCNTDHWYDRAKALEAKLAAAENGVRYALANLRMNKSDEAFLAAVLGGRPS